ncbi:MAG: DUF1684 domain-containing protein [Salibacteraceae bacterium]
MKYILIIFLLPFSIFSQKNLDSVIVESKSFQLEMNESYADSNHSPLTKEDLANFEELPFFEIDSSFYVVARFERAPKSKSIKFKTSTDRRPKYEIYGTIYFKINQQPFSLKVYQSHRLREREEFKDYLFLPFTDLTNGKTSYAGGRYIDLKVPEGTELIVNFNKAYNPYCAYSSLYSCPIVPEENFLDIEINAGVKAPINH